MAEEHAGAGQRSASVDAQQRASQEYQEFQQFVGAKLRDFGEQVTQLTHSGMRSERPALVLQQIREKVAESARVVDRSMAEVTNALSASAAAYAQLTDESAADLRAVENAVGTFNYDIGAARR